MSTQIELTSPGTDLAGSRPIFPAEVGHRFNNGFELPDFRNKRLVFSQLLQPGQIHVYRANCRAGERLRVQMFVPKLPRGGAVAPAFAVVGQSLPYSADTQRLPLEAPAGYSAVVGPASSKLVAPVTDLLTRVPFYPGPVIDTRTLVGGRCYILVWSPQNLMGKYVLQIGHRWPLRWSYWAQIPRFWWQIRGWAGLDRLLAYMGAIVLLLSLFVVIGIRHKRQ